MTTASATCKQLALAVTERSPPEREDEQHRLLLEEEKNSGAAPESGTQEDAPRR